MPSVRLALLASLLVFSSCRAGIAPRPATSAVSGSPPVVREILTQLDNPPGAPGQRLTLARYTIAPRAQLAPHLHPGIQMASIASGTLTYSILSGSATIYRRVAANGTPAAIEVLVGPAETEMFAGDAVIEVASMRHFGANRTALPVVILATLLTDPALDLSVSAPAANQ